MKRLLCFLGLHAWIYGFPTDLEEPRFFRYCRRCRKLEEV